MSELICICPDYYGSCYLVIDDEHAVIFDPGMAWHALETIDRIKAKAGSRKVDAIFLTHSHYDHLSGVPLFKKEWPEVPVYAAPNVKKILGKESARATMKALSEEAAVSNGTKLPDTYDESLLMVDESIEPGSAFDFGSIHVEAVDCYGHTKDSYSYVIDNHMLVASETLGMIYGEGHYEPQCLVSFKESFKSLERCSKYDIDVYGMPHMGPIMDFSAKGMWDEFKKGLEETTQIIIDIIKRNATLEDQMKEMDAIFLVNRGPELNKVWPYEAFYLNAVAMLKTVTREYFEA